MKDRTREPTASDAGVAAQGFPRKYREHLRMMKHMSDRAAKKQQSQSQSQQQQQQQQGGNKKKTAGSNGKATATAASAAESVDAIADAAAKAAVSAGAKPGSAAARRAAIQARDDALRRMVNRSAKSTTSKFQKRKAWLEARKAKNAKGRKTQSETSGSDNDGDDGGDGNGPSRPPTQKPAQHGRRGEEIEKKLKDHIPFGQVVQAPPTITVVPKKRKEFVAPGSAKQPAISASVSGAATAAAAAPSTKQSDSPDDPLDVAKVGRKRKLRDLPQAEKVVLLREREQAIALYRQSKAQRDAEKAVARAQRQAAAPQMPF
nr:hypothetical protein HK105_006095 [Polyrhizophydium stewartii]